MEKMTKKDLINEIKKLNDNFVSMLINHTKQYNLDAALECNKAYITLMEKIIYNLDVKEK